jgi:2-polyprenyl-3-methyl-5-hydroxy-6-metoxy-1,4-benzoquinol methylase
MRQLTDDFELRFRTGDTPWEDPQAWQGLDQLFARFVPLGSRVLDVGCGLGTNALRLAALGHRVLGVDVSPAAIEQALVRRAAANVDCEFRCADFLAGGLGVFDVVFDRGCLHGFADAAGRASFAATVAAALPPGGLWIDVSGSSDNGDSPDTVRELALPRLGLSDLAAASEALFEAVEIAQAVYGATPSTAFRAWSGVFRRREVGSADEGGSQANRAVARGQQAVRADKPQPRY